MGLDSSCPSVFPFDKGKVQACERVFFKGKSLEHVRDYFYAIMRGEKQGENIVTIADCKYPLDTSDHVLRAVEALYLASTDERARICGLFCDRK